MLDVADEKQYVKKILQYRNNPLLYVKENFTWGYGALKEHEGPDIWQERVLKDIGEECQKRDDQLETRPMQFAIASGHGIGKTAFTSMLIKWFMATRPNPQVIVTANTGSQLSSKTWRELAKWNELGRDKHLFEHTATKFMFKEAAKTHFAEAVTWAEHRPEALAGAHEKYLMYIVDEGSNIPSIIFETIYGALTTENGHCILVVLGNPTRNVGEFREFFGKNRHRWKTYKVDSRESRFTNKALIKEWIDDKGLDSDFIKVRVLGEFPSKGGNQLFDVEDIYACLKYDYIPLDSTPVLIGVDLARSENGDESVIAIRKGRKFLDFISLRTNNSIVVADKLISCIRHYNPKEVNIDGTGLGGIFVDMMRQNGYKCNDINFGGDAIDKVRFRNKRVEIYFKLSEAVKEGISIPNCQQLIDDLIGIQYKDPSISTKDERICLKSKEEMRKDGLASPNYADAAALTYAKNINESSNSTFFNKTILKQSSYDQFKSQMGL